MKLKYVLNLRLYEVCVRLINHYRWQGMDALNSVIEEYRNENAFDENVLNLLEYGAALVCEGRAPDTVSFLIMDEMHVILMSHPTSLTLKRDLNLVSQFVKWLQQMDTHSHQVLLDSLDDIELRSKYKNWINLNEYKLSLSFSEFLLLDNVQISQIIHSNPLVKTHYESLIKGGLR